MTECRVYLYQLSPLRVSLTEEPFFRQGEEYVTLSASAFGWRLIVASRRAVSARSCDLQAGDWLEIFFVRKT